MNFFIDGKWNCEDYCGFPACPDPVLLSLEGSPERYLQAERFPLSSSKHLLTEPWQIQFYLSTSFTKRA
jgi:hypothetical protein